MGPVLGVAYMLAMAAWAGRAAALDEREGGSQARQIDAVVHGPFGGEIHRMEMAIAAAAIAVGILLGGAASLLVALRDRVAAAPSRRPVWLRWLMLAAIVAALQAGLELWAMAVHPQLYASAWYARGGWRRMTQVLATDVLGPRGTAWLVVIGCVAFVVGPIEPWRAWPERASRATEALGSRLEALALRSWVRRRTLALCLAVGAALALFGAALAHAPAASALPANDARQKARGPEGIRTATAGGARTSGTSRRPNVLVIAADSLRADRLDPRTAPSPLRARRPRHASTARTSRCRAPSRRGSPS